MTGMIITVLKIKEIFLNLMIATINKKVDITKEPALRIILLLKCLTSKILN
jgi:hypothetical protein